MTNWQVIKKTLATIGLAISSFWLWVIWLIVLGVYGVLLLIDLTHIIWTGRRIHWIEYVTNGMAGVFNHPFSKS